jgi:hypothetical protein
MTSYILVLILITQNGSFMGNMDYDSKKLCKESGEQFINDTKDIAAQAKYLCLERK